MKLRILYFFVVVLIAVGCSKEESFVRDYPEIISSKLASNEASGVSFEVVVGALNRDKIVDHGVVWSTRQETLSLTSAFAVHLGPISGDSFSVGVQTQLKSGVRYYARAYLKTDRIVVYGVPISFVSLGSLGPSITSVSPMTLGRGDLVTIKGERFGTDTSQVKAFLAVGGLANPMKIKTLKDTEIVAIAPNKIFDKGFIGVQTTGNDGFAQSKEVAGKIPTMTNITGTDNCSPFQINGINFLLFGAPTQVLVNEVPIAMPPVTDTSITLPAIYHSPKLLVRLRYGSTLSFSAQLDDPVPMPTVTSVPSSFTAQGFVVTGTNFPVCGGLSITSTGANLTMSAVSSNQLNVTVSGRPCSAFKFTLSYHGKVVYTSGDINPPITSNVTSVSPLTGKPGDHIIIRGTDLDNLYVAVNIGYTERTLEISGNTTQLDAIMALPDQYISDLVPNDDVTLYVRGCTQQWTYTYHLDFLPIGIDDLNPKVNDHTQMITLTGTNFLSDPNLEILVVDPGSGYFYGYASVYDISDTQIQVYPPSNTYYGTAVIIIRSFGRTIYSPQFQFNP